MAVTELDTDEPPILNQTIQYFQESTTINMILQNDHQLNFVAFSTSRSNFNQNATRSMSIGNCFLADLYLLLNHQVQVSNCVAEFSTALSKISAERWFDNQQDCIFPISCVYLRSIQYPNFLHSNDLDLSVTKQGFYLSDIESPFVTERSRLFECGIQDIALILNKLRKTKIEITYS